MINVELTEQEALLFRAFREHQEAFDVMLKSGVFNVRSGKAVLNFNMEGVLDSVYADIPVYKRGHSQIQFLSLEKK